MNGASEKLGSNLSNSARSMRAKGPGRSRHWAAIESWIGSKSAAIFGMMSAMSRFAPPVDERAPLLSMAARGGDAMALRVDGRVDGFRFDATQRR